MSHYFVVINQSSVFSGTDIHTLIYKAQQKTQESPSDTIVLKDREDKTLFNFKYLHNPLVNAAFLLSIEYHKTQKRKGDKRPYTEHPLRVAHLTQKMTDSLEAIAGALGHDLLEDTDCTEDEIRKKCSLKVLEIIQTLSEDKSILAWETRKQQYIDAVSKGPIEAHFICLADKIANMESLKTQYHIYGNNVWEWFSGTEGVQTRKYWFERSVFAMLQSKPHIPKEWIARYDALIQEIYEPHK